MCVCVRAWQRRFPRGTPDQAKVFEELCVSQTSELDKTTAYTHTHIHTHTHNHTHSQSHRHTHRHSRPTNMASPLITYCTQGVCVEGVCDMFLMVSHKEEQSYRELG